MEDELLKVFVTMQADPDMLMKAWAHSVEELCDAVGKTQGDCHWSDFVQYGPDSTSFNATPTVCLEARMTSATALGLQAAIEDNPWISVPVTISIAQKVKHQ